MIKQKTKIVTLTCIRKENQQDMIVNVYLE
jgi:hypothetical protein